MSFTLNSFITCPNVFTVDFEQVSAGWEAKGRINYRIPFKCFKINLLQTKQVRQTKISFDIFIEIMFAFLIYLLIENFKPES